MCEEGRRKEEQSLDRECELGKFRVWEGSISLARNNKKHIHETRRGVV